MKQLLKKLFAFIITVMFFSLKQFANGQVHPSLGGGYFCYCANVKLGCRGNPNCVVFCSKACKPKTIKIIRNPSNDSSFSTIYPNVVSKSNMISFELPQSKEMNLPKLFESKNTIRELPANSQSQSIRKLEWEALDIDALNSLSN